MSIRIPSVSEDIRFMYFLFMCWIVETCFIIIDKKNFRNHANVSRSVRNHMWPLRSQIIFRPPSDVCLLVGINQLDFVKLNHYLVNYWSAVFIFNAFWFKFLSEEKFIDFWNLLTLVNRFNQIKIQIFLLFNWF